MTSEEDSEAVEKRSDQLEKPSEIRLEEGYKPKPRTEKEREAKKGFQPKPTGKPEGQNPPSGGSNVTPPPAAPAEKEKKG